MPEVLSKHPEITLEVLASGGAQCGKGAKQEILKACPAARFCKLPGGEVCVYGVADAGRMTQLGVADWKAVFNAVNARSGGSDPGGGAATGLALLAAIAFALVLRQLRD